MGPISRCCNAICFMAGTDKPCWGDVSVVDEECAGTDDAYWVHGCEGHTGYLEYEEPPEGCDTIRADDTEHALLTHKVTTHG